MWTWLVGAAALAGAPSAACEQPTTMAGIRADVGAAIGAFAENDGPVFEAAMARVDHGVPCLAEVVLPGDVAELHRAKGLAAFYRQEPDYAIQAFQAALLLQPGYNLPTTIAPQPGPLWTLYDRARSRPAPPTTPMGAFGVAIYVDGARDGARAPSLPSLLQVQGADGSVLSTQYLLANEGAHLDPSWMVGPSDVVGSGSVGAGGDASGDPTDAGGEIGEAPRGRKVRFGVEVGAPTGVLVEVPRDSKVISAVGLEFGAVPLFADPRAVLVLGPSVDWHLSGPIELRTSFGIASRGDSAGFWLNPSVQYDLKGPMQVDLGLSAAKVKNGDDQVEPLWLDLGVAWLW